MGVLMFGRVLRQDVSASTGTTKQKPTIDEVLKYAKPLTKKFISDFAGDAPIEHKEEIEQSAYLRLIEIYPTIDADSGWRSFVYTHCRGAVLDFLRLGKGFAEERQSIRKDELHGSTNVNKIRERISSHSDDGELFDVDQALGENGIFAGRLSLDAVNIRWELVARMAGNDAALHAFAKWIRGFTLEEMAPTFGVTRPRVGQLIQEFMAKFDDPKLAGDTWFLQSCYAFGLCTALGIPDLDQSVVMGHSIGWGLIPVDLDSREPMPGWNHVQLSLFDAG